MYPVKVNGKWGFINKKGEMIIQPKYDRAEHTYSSGLNIVEDKEGYFLIDNAGKALSGEHYTARLFNSRDHIISFKNKMGRWGALDSTGKIMIPFRYSEFYFNDGIGVIYNDSMQGYLDMKGNFTSLRGYDNLNNLGEGYIKTIRTIEKGKYLYGIYSTTLKKVICEPKFTFMYDVKNHRVNVNDRKGPGLLNAETGEYVVKPHRGQSISYVAYTTFRPEERRPNAICWVKNSGSAMLIDPDGKTIAQLDGEGRECSVSVFYNGYAIILKEDKSGDKFGLMDSTGKIVIPVIYDDMAINSNGLVPAMKNKKWGYLDLKGNTIVDFIYELTVSFTYELGPVMINCKRKPSAYETENCKTGYVDASGKVIWAPSE
ncbi:MAG: WG repeat-containing protein [Bacteroidia bacterium]